MKKLYYYLILAFIMIVSILVITALMDCWIVGEDARWQTELAVLISIAITSAVRALFFSDNQIKITDAYDAYSLGMSLSSFRKYAKMYNELNLIMDKNYTDKKAIQKSLSDFCENLDKTIDNINEDFDENKLLEYETYYFEQQAKNNPDAKIASELRMTPKRFCHYEKLYDEYQTFLKDNDIDSPASNKKFSEIFEQVGIPNEWRRYSNYRIMNNSHFIDNFTSELKKFTLELNISDYTRIKNE